MIYPKGQTNLLPWLIKAGDDGITKDCVLVAKMSGNDMQSVSLYVVNGAKEDYAGK